MFEVTLVIWITEFGRMPFTPGSTGRDHNGGTLVTRLVGAGIQGGTAYGESDEFTGASFAKSWHALSKNESSIPMMGNIRVKTNRTWLGGWTAAMAGAILVATMAACIGCGRPTGPRPSERAVEDWDDVDPPRQLSQLALFSGPLRDLTPATDAVGYRINSEGFFDYAETHRVLKLPPGKPITYAASGPLEFPVKTILAQTLGFSRATAGDSRRWVETRVIARTKSGWIGMSYVWNAELTEATLAIVGDVIMPTQFEKEGVVVPARRHIVPNMNDCKRCHKVGGRYQPLGVTAEQLNGEFAGGSGVSQLETWSRRGLLVGLPARDQVPRLPAWQEPRSGTVAQRARAWLQVNCAHCHDPVGAARNSGLYLGANVPAPILYGVFKTPVAAGRGSGRWQYDVYPGRPEESILLYRISSVEPGVVMPEYGRSVVHSEGMALIKQWIAQMKDDSASDKMVGEVRELSTQQLAEWVDSVTKQGNADRGEEVFHRRELNCLQCHALGPVGGRVGPDLLKLPADTTVAYLVESVLLPSKVVKPEFAAVTVETRDGRVLTGIRVQDSSDAVVLRDPVRGDTVVPKSDVESVTRSGSLMPTNVVSRVDKQDFLDLVRFLATLPKAGPRVAQSRAIYKYEALDPVPPEVIDAPATQVNALLAKLPQEMWRPVFARLDGHVPIASIKSQTNSKRAFVRATLQAKQDSTLHIELPDSVRAEIWINGQQLGPKGRQSRFAAGEGVLWIMTETNGAAAGSLRVELSPFTESVNARRFNPGR